MSTERRTRVRGRRRWIPVIWCCHGGVYVAVFLARGRPLPAALTAAFVALVAVGLAFEMRGPIATQPRLLGWEQDERQQRIHQQAMALVGYATVAGVAIAGFVATLTHAAAAFWPMLALVALIAVYGVGLAVFRRWT
ncbi:hypothetical protein SRB5_32230 [Streptomyces sp. RB5]|uniref:DUF2178 domain-containing protein n=1 Tax=Streptomyces smaragdinus TaxID=2585196 RepID=A0A7K0CIB3_9ACTN|nr:hypothetical protein [Streptomyces smaragdinus]MQY13083.1 hypothetical protein [Streptomyces smaragdinus]